MSNFDAIRTIHNEVELEPMKEKQGKNFNFPVGLILTYVFGLIFAFLIYQNPAEAIGRVIGLSLLWECPIIGFVFGGVIIGKGADIGSQVLGVGLMLYAVLMFLARKHSAVPKLYN